MYSGAINKNTDVCLSDVHMQAEVRHLITIYLKESTLACGAQAHRLCTIINIANITIQVQFINNCITTVKKRLGWAYWMQLLFS